MVTAQVGEKGERLIVLLERLDTAALREAYVEAVMPAGMSASDQERARSRGAEFAGVVLRHAFGDDTALDLVEDMVRGAAADSLRGGRGPGPILERLDGG